MIPLQLTLKNFMCYRGNAPVLDLEPLHVACLSGQNGHGKTALLDAITWALWGHARARTQEELVHQGERDMAVDLEFMARDQRHRVIRRHSRSLRGGQGSTILELQVSSGNGFRPISGNTLRETEAEIDKLLHMDYDTFINTAYLRQGDADAFTAARPAERKRVLAEVLDLAYYERLEDRARDRSRSLQDKIRDTDIRIEVRRQETAARPERERALAVTAAEHETLEGRLESAQRRWRQVEEAVNALRAGEVELADLERRIAVSETDAAELDRRIEEHRKRMDDAEALVARAHEIDAGHARLAQLRRDVERLGNDALASARLQGEAARLTGEIDVQLARLTGERGRLRSRIAQELEPGAVRISTIEGELADIAEKQNILDAQESEIEREKETVRRLGHERDALGRALEARTSIEERKADIEREIAVQETRLREQISYQSRRIADLKSTADGVGPTERRLGELAAESAEIDSQSVDMEASRRELESIEGRIQYLQQANEALVADMREGRQKFDILMAEDQAKCPVCNHQLGADAMQHLTAEYERQGLDQKRRYSKNDAERRVLETSRDRLSGDIRRRSADLDGRRRRTQQEMAERKAMLREGAKAQENMGTLQAWLDQFEGNLNTGNFAQDEKAQLRRIVEEFADVEYDPERRREIEQELSAAQRSVETRQRALGLERQSLQANRGRLEAELRAANQAADELPAARRKLEDLGRILSTEAFAQDERVRLQTLQAELAELGYDAERHRSAQACAAELEPYEEISRALSRAREDLPRLGETLLSDTTMLDRRRSELDAARRRQGDLQAAVDSIPAREQELDAAAQDRDRLEEQARAADAERRSLSQQLDRIGRLEAETRRLETDRRELAQEKSAYDDLAAAFGKNGVQALIIEAAIPQLEDDANELLARLAESRLTLRLQLQEGRRDRRTGLPSEELDIKIGDEIGTRAYETFSGGEAFRINFALRIALSKLLARRSGAPLPILFIDEGFGALDASGQERLTQAIQSIEDDFDKIIVITHIDQIKEAFPTRIEITKTPTGSTFKVV